MTEHGDGNGDHGHAHGSLGHGGHGHGHGGHGHDDHGHGHGGHGHDDHAHGHGGHGHGVPTSAGFVPASGPSLVRFPLPRGAGQGKTLHLDAQSGISGNMTIGALADLGVPRAVFEAVVPALGLSGVELAFRDGYSGVIGSLHFDVHVQASQPSRSYGAIRELIERAPLEPGVKGLAGRIFERLAVAEAEVHRTELDLVTFHEVGAVDALVDIVGAAAGFEYLGGSVTGSRLPLGVGYVNCEHGRLPLPAPATLLCLRGVPTRPSNLEVELVTPTGAAIFGAIVERVVDWPELAVERVGWGAGTRGLPDRPNALRLVLGSVVDPRLTAAGRSTLALELDEVVELSANVDDGTGEAAAHALGLLLDAGALDVWLTPVTMKKGRPGLVFGVLAPRERAAALAELLLVETTTLGVRQKLVPRFTLPRRIEVVETTYGTIPVKIAGEPPLKLKPEVDVCARIAREQGVPLSRVLQAAEDAARRLLEDERA